MLNWLTSLFSKGASELVGTLGEAVDRLVTSDEERLVLKNELKAAVLTFKQSQLEFVAKYDEQITKRHATDMASDSWLSKNVRPVVIGFLTGATVLLAYLSIFTLEVSEIILVTPWIDLLQVLLVTVYAFYFGSRGIEKVRRIQNGNK